MHIRQVSPYLTEIPANFNPEQVWNTDRLGNGFLMESWVVAHIVRNIIARTIAAEAQNHRCAYCADPTDAFGPSEKRPTLEHIVPRARGGLRWHTMNHLMVCDQCNVRRGERELPEIEQMVPAEGRETNFIPPRRSYTISPPFTSRRYNRRRAANASGFRWNNHQITLSATGEVLGSMYQLSWYGPWTIRVSDTAFAEPGEFEPCSTRSQAQQRLEQIASRMIAAHRMWRTAYETEVAAMFSRASTIRPTLAA